MYLIDSSSTCRRTDAPDVSCTTATALKRTPPKDRDTRACEFSNLIGQKVMITFLSQQI